MYEDIQFESDDGIATVTIDRPDVYNAFRQQTIQELNECLRSVRANDGLYVLILTGAGKGFCSGADVNSMPNWDEMTKEKYGGFLRGVQNVVRQLRTMEKPTIGAVNGPAIGAGCDFALACDLRVVGEGALLKEGFVQVGLISGDGGGWMLPRLIGESRAKELLLTGRDISPEEAVEWGLAVEIAEDSVATARDWAERLLDLPAHAVRRTKRLMDPALSFDEYCEKAIDYQWECIQDPEHAEAVAAFREKREPQFDRNLD